MMMNLYRNIKIFREKRGLSQEELALLTGYSDRTSVSKIESGKIDLSQSKMMQFADALGVTVGDLWDWTEDLGKLPFKTNAVPLIGQIAAGSPILAEENIEDYFNLDSRIKADFCLRVKGDSMIDEGIYPEDIVFIKKQDDVDNGEIGAVVIDEEATLKRVHKENGSLILQPANKNYKPMFFTGGNVRIVGKLAAVLNIRE